MLWIDSTSASLAILFCPSLAMPTSFLTSFPVTPSPQEAMRKLNEEDKEKIAEQVEYFRTEKLKFDAEVAKWDDTGNDIIVIAKTHVHDHDGDDGLHQVRGGPREGGGGYLLFSSSVGFWSDICAKTFCYSTYLEMAW